MAVVTIADLLKARKLAKRRKFQGLDISVETAKGGYRHWYDPDAGEHGRTKMPHDYGYVRGSVGADGEHVDCYVGPNENATHAYVVDQMKKPAFMTFDEQKVMLGFDSAEAAKRAYLSCYNDPRFFGGMRAIPMADFKRQVLSTSEHQPLVMSERQAGAGGDGRGPVDSHGDTITTILRKGLPHKYKRRWKGADGEWRYEYDEPTHTTGRTGTQPNQTAHQALAGEVARSLFDKLAVEKAPRIHAKGAFELTAPSVKLPSITVPTVRGTKQQVHVVVVKDSKAPGMEGSFGFRTDWGPPGVGHSITGWVLTVRVPPGMHDVEQQGPEVRSVIAHELTHAREGMGRMEMRAAAQAQRDKGTREAYRAYRNQKIEVTAKINEIHREITDKKSVAYLRQVMQDHEQAKEDWEQEKREAGGEDPGWKPGQPNVSWMLRHVSEQWAQADDLDLYTPENQKRILRAAFDTMEGVLGGRVASIEKSDRLPGGLADKKKPGDFDAEQLAAGIKVEMEHTSDRALAREIAMDHLTEDADYYRKLARMEKAGPFIGPKGGKAWKKSFPRLHTLQVSLLKGGKPPAGYAPIPGGRKGGYRKRVGKGWSYWYPTAGDDDGKHAPAEYSEADFEAGNFDKTPGHWHFVRQNAKRTEITAWTAGGVDPHSKHPVKRGGQEGRLYQIVDPQPAEHPGWAMLKDVNSGETTLVKHTLVYPVEHSRERKQTRPKPSGGKFTPGTPTPKPRTGWVSGSDVKLQPYTDSRAKKGTMLHRVERGHYPRKRRRVFREDADGVPRRQEDEVLAMPEGDKVLLLGEMQGLVRKAADKARRKLGVAKSAAVMEDLHSAAMEGLLHAIDNYKGGYSFAKSAMTYAEQHARLHAAREFAGGWGMTQAEQRIMPGFLAARAEANAAVGGEADVRTIADHWKLRKRDRHKGLTQGKNDPIPLNDYALRAGEIVTGKDKPGKLKLARHFAEFLDGQRSQIDVAEDEGYALPGAGVGYGMGATERMEMTHDLSVALESVTGFDVVVSHEVEGKRRDRVYRVNAADVIKRRLGLGQDPQSPRAIAGDVPIYRIARGGDLKQLSPRAAFDVIGPTVDQALERIRGELEGPTAGLVERAARELAEPATVARGMTTYQRIEADSRKVSREDIREWRASERTRLKRLEDRYRHEGDDERADTARRMRDRIKTIGRKEAARHIAEMRVLQRPKSREWFRNAVARPVELLDPRNEYGSAVITMTDLGTGRQRRVKVRTVRDFSSGDEAYKSDADPGTVPDMGTLRMVTLFPRLSQVLWGSDDPLAYAPSVERASVLEAMGF